MSDQGEARRFLICRGFLLGTGFEAPPASGATKTILDTTLTTNGQWPAFLGSIDGVQFDRLQLNIYSSHDSGASGVVFSSSFDRGTNFRTQSTATYLNADGATTYDYLMRGGHVKIAYTNSANTLTAWEMELFGIYDRHPGS